MYTLGKKLRRCIIAQRLYNSGGKNHRGVLSHSGVYNSGKKNNRGVYTSSEEKSKSCIII